MVELDDLIDLFFENIQRLFFPEDWLQLDLKFSKSELLTLLYLDKKREITMTELSDYLNTPMSTANGIAERLLKKGCIARERTESDRRLVVLRPAEKGGRLIADLKETASGYVRMALEELSGEEIQFLIDTVLKIVRCLQQKTKTEALPEDGELRKIEIQ